MKTQRKFQGYRLIVGQMPFNLHFILMAFLDNLFSRLLLFFDYLFSVLV